MRDSNQKLAGDRARLAMSQASWPTLKPHIAMPRERAEYVLPRTAGAGMQEVWAPDLPHATWILKAEVGPVD